MRFQLSEQTVKVSSVNPRAELHGAEPKPACDIHFETLFPSDRLAEFHPELRGLLFKKAEAPDLADQGSDNPTALRFPMLEGKLKWKGEVAGAEITVHYGTTDRSHIKLGGCLVNDFKLAPMEGGSVSVYGRIQAHPDEKAFGKLCTLVGSEIPLTITPPESAQEEIEAGKE